VGAELVWRCLQACGAPASDFAGLAALFHEKVEGEARGGRGLLIGSAGARIKHAVKGIEGGGYCLGRKRSLRGSREEEDGAD
jgi:hypothetical protein